MLFPIPDACGPLLRMQVVVAHPDDETFGCGSLLLAAAQCGAVTSVTCATRGEAGEVSVGVAVPEGGVAALREAELREAARLLGVRRVEVLDFRDSGTVGHCGPETLAGAPEADVLAAVDAAVEAFRPDALLTLDASDGHRDHARVRDVTVAVGRARGIPVYLKVGEAATPDEENSVVLDSTVYLDQRWAAIRAHRSQASPFEGLPDSLARTFLASDHLVAVT